ncbi:hypothetical protein C8U37_10456 [Trichococcus patagoniensis]|uniref:Uncharacterized protein n=1 Tax=Trichococcus patagoniensis TaxID=382641 RepID=A0A2T5INN7_9LACT|nr:hypothetical protein C8U37_10456 [Trichococcus patagoniensis]
MSKYNKKKGFSLTYEKVPSFFISVLLIFGGTLPSSGERRFRRSSPNILTAFSDESGLVGVQTESYRQTPASGSLTGAEVRLRGSVSLTNPI